MWAPLLKDFEEHLQYGGVDHISIYYVMRALAAVDMLQESITKGLVMHLIKRGYDGDDFLNMHDDKTNLRRSVHLIMLISYSFPDIKNKNFNSILSDFTAKAINSENLSILQSFELLKALRNFKNFKSAALEKSLKKKAFSNLVTDGASEEDIHEQVDKHLEDEDKNTDVYMLQKFFTEDYSAFYSEAEEQE